MVQADVRSILPSAGHSPSNFISCLAVATETTMTRCGYLWVLAHRITSRNPQKSSEHLVRFLGDREGCGTPFRSERLFCCAAQYRWEEPLPGDRGQPQPWHCNAPRIEALHVPSGRVLQDASSPRMIRLQSVVVFGTS